MNELNDSMPSENKFINASQLLLNYLCLVGGRQDYDKLLLALDEIFISLNKKKAIRNIVFHGCRKDGKIRGETISNELWYWISNGFINQKSIEENKILIEFTEKARILFCKEKLDSEINQSLSNQTKMILRETINSTIDSLSK